MTITKFYSVCEQLRNFVSIKLIFWGNIYCFHVFYNRRN